MDREKHVCPACGQTVDTVVRRHKTLGAWVPRWVAGPCHNPDCEACVEPGGEQHGRTEHPKGTEHPEQQGRAESSEHADERSTPAPPAS